MRTRSQTLRFERVKMRRRVYWRAARSATARSKPETAPPCCRERQTRGRACLARSLHSELEPPKDSWLATEPFLDVLAANLKAKLQR